MAFVKAITALTVLAAIVFPALAKDIYVGDDYGWKLDFDYEYWAKGKEFYVGDRLIFVYNKEMHNVLKVNNRYDFQRCVKQYGVAAPFTGGYNVIELTSPGKKWYLCGVTNHCDRGMKLAIYVKPKKEEYKHNQPPYQQNGYPFAPYSNEKTYN